MKLSEIKEESIRSISDKELLNLHFRLHQLYTNAKKLGKRQMSLALKRKHKIVITEMGKRAKEHKSPMLLKSLKDFLEVGYAVN